MTTDDEASRADQQDEFMRESAEDRVGIVAEFWDFLKHNKKWWLLPILLVLIVIGVLAALTSTGAAPFIYPLF